MDHKKITLSVIERVITVFFENPENLTVGVERFMLDEPACGRRHVWTLLSF